MIHRNTEKVISAVFNADRWTELAGLQETKPEAQEYSTLNVISKITGHVWEVTVQLPSTDIVHDSLAKTNAILITTSGRTLEEVSRVFSARGIEQLVQGITYLGPINGCANVADDQILLKLFKFDHHERNKLAEKPQSHKTIEEREARKTEIREKIAKSERDVPESIRRALGPNEHDDPFKIAEALDRDDRDHDAQRQEQRGIVPTPSHLQREFEAEHWSADSNTLFNTPTDATFQIYDPVQECLVDIPHKALSIEQMSAAHYATGSK